MSSPGQGPLAFHGTRAGRTEQARALGYTRADSAFFVPALDRSGGSDGARARLERSVGLALWFGLGMSTLREWTAEPPGHLCDYFTERPDRLPALSLARLPVPLPARSRRYRTLSRPDPGPTVPYLKVAWTGPILPAAVCHPALPITLAQVHQAHLAAEQAPGPLDDRCFYRHAEPDPSGAPDPVTEPTSGGCGAVRIADRHPDPVLRAPLVCRALAASLSPAVQSILRADACPDG